MLGQSHVFLFLVGVGFVLRVRARRGQNDRRVVFRMVDARIAPVLEDVTRIPPFEADVVGVWLHIDRGVGPCVRDRQTLAVRGELEYFAENRRPLSPSASEAHESRSEAR